MSSTPAGFHIPPAIFADAIRYFWAQRDRQAASAHGGEGQGRNVRGGRHLDEVQASIVSLMIDHGVGVTTDATYEVKRIDADYFLDE